MRLTSRRQIADTDCRYTSLPNYFFSQLNVTLVWWSMFQYIVANVINAYIASPITIQLPIVLSNLIPEGTHNIPIICKQAPVTTEGQHSLIRAGRGQSHELELMTGNLTATWKCFNLTCYQVITLSLQDTSAASTTVLFTLAFLHSTIQHSSNATWNNPLVPAIQRKMNWTEVTFPLLCTLWWFLLPAVCRKAKNCHLVV